MDKTIALGGNIVGLAGVLLTVVAGVARIMGHYHLAGFEIMTLIRGRDGADADRQLRQAARSDQLARLMTRFCGC